jgi:hypothetical protein
MLAKLAFMAASALLFLALFKLAKIMLERIAMIAITTRSSIRVKPE